jgi:predicted enzyme related to lactoylglutathione lyase
MADTVPAMGERTSYAPGTFCWADLSTTDPEGAKAFYGTLFGWQTVDFPMPDGEGVYSMQQLDGKDVCAISGQPPQQREAGVPPMWNHYVAVEDADAAVAKAKELGGAAHAQAFDVEPAGRMAVLQDPAGAFFMPWQPNEHPGAGLVNAHGAITWNELHTPDVDAAFAFYGELFGWAPRAMEGPGGRYEAIMVGERGNGGISDHMEEGAPPHWLLYFGTDDVGASLQCVNELGGRVLMADTDIGVGHIAVAQDPQGAIFALFAGDFED